MKKALLSVSDKTGLAEFARGLVSIGYELLSTGGTAKLLRTEGLAVTDISDYTGFPEMMDGRVKTLHPKVHGGILARRNRPDDMRVLAESGMAEIDVVAVNLYPFERRVFQEKCSFDEAIEEIDIGGPTLVRAAAKNYRDVCVVIDPEDYPEVLRKLKAGGLVEEDRLKLARKVFARIAEYDAAISNYFSGLHVGSGLPDTLTLQFKKTLPLRYGENPHQRGAAYGVSGLSTSGVLNARKLHGKELSYNNLLDAEVAYNLARLLPRFGAVVVKHNNPSGSAVHGSSLRDAYSMARDGDPVSAFGGVVAVNAEVDLPTAQEITKIFTEVLAAPGFAPAALQQLRVKKDLRLLQLEAEAGPGGVPLDIRTIGGGGLIQDPDSAADENRDWKVVTRRSPTEREQAALSFAWKVCRFVKSNAIVLAREDRTLGIGAGQMSRIDSVRIAAAKMREFKLESDLVVMASDAFFPFRDGLDEAAKAGARAVIQPGGSVKDKDVIAAADEHGMAMVFTGRRHFRH